MKKIASLLILLILQVGCIQPQIIENLGIITARGIDVVDDGQLEKTVNVMSFDANRDELFTVYSGISSTLKGAREVIAFQVNKILTEGQINVELYGREAAEQGITRYFMSAFRDARTSDTMFLAIADGSAKEIFYAQSEQAKNIGQHLETLLKKENKFGSIPPVTLQDFSRTAGRMGQDAVLPIITLKNDVPSLKSLALFKNDQLVEEVSLHEAMLINTFNHHIQEITVEITLPFEPFKDFIGQKNLLHNVSDGKNIEELAVQFMIVEGKSKTKLTNKKDLFFRTDVKFNISLLEISSPILIDKKEIAETFEKEIEKKLKKQYEELLEKAKTVKSDPFGYGKRYRIHTKSGRINEEDWHEKFPEIQVDFNIDVRIMNSGSIQ